MASNVESKRKLIETLRDLLAQYHNAGVTVYDVNPEGDYIGVFCESMGNFVDYDILKYLLDNDRIFWFEVTVQNVLGIGRFVPTLMIPVQEKLNNNQDNE